ncbi:hypothetical protein OG453_44775 [Streptomyces sp. NBC_01381]|uniref:hypothetical protein n=1 Tax=Streptomyces sp. NBC_01381 TaxID=2903845 RepID=UPI0022575071|nr:hypothetical protein [Streptomyces sp. NBC_01381]MCX4673674.1 hypothetical protein [Streptomyces sp. NBC_01381]
MNTAHVDNNVVNRLNAEWRWLCDRPAPAAQVRGWLIEAGVVDEQTPHRLDELHDLLQQRSQEEGRRFSDAWLTVLLERAVSEGEQAQLAARVVVQAMLPGAVRMTRRCLRAGEEFTDVAQLVVAALYQVVRSFPIERRHRQLARNLRLELWHIVSRELGREFAPSGEELPGEKELREGSVADPLAQAEVVLLANAAEAAGLRKAAEPVEELAGARGELVELLVWALAEKHLTTDAAAAISDHYREAGAVEDLAAARAAGVSAAAIRQKRRRAVVRLRAAAPLWAAAA